MERELAAGQSGIDDTRELRVLPLGLPGLNRSVVKEMTAHEFRKHNSYSSYVR